MTRRRRFLLCLAAVVFCSVARSVPDSAAGMPVPVHPARDWAPGGKAPAARAAPGGGIRFDCPFSSGADRAFWDRDVRLDFSGRHGLEVVYRVENPAAFRALSLYLRSGPGWYEIRLPADRPGRRRVAVPTDRWVAQDAPAGVASIGGIRLSPWSANSTDGAIVLEGLAGYRAALALVRPTSSLPDDGERAFGGRLLHWIGGELETMGVPFALVDDDAVGAGALRGLALALLPYNTQPGPASLRALRAFVGDGGKLIVFYSTCPELGALLGVRPLPYRHDPRPGRWHSMVFDSRELPGAPGRVMQTATRNIVPAEPLDGRTRVVGWWEHAQGGRTGEAAWLLSDRGAWMTHVLLREDAAAKRRLLAAVLAALHPPLLDRIAHEAARTAPMIGNADDLESAIAYLDGLSRRSDRRLPPSWAGELRRMNPAGIPARTPFAVLDHAQVLRRSLSAYYAAALPAPPPSEVRAVWDHTGQGLHAGCWSRTRRTLQSAGLTDVFFHVARGTVHDPAQPPQPLAGALAALDGSGLRLHAWKILWNLDGMPAAEREALQARQRLQSSISGATLPWLCPSHPDNLAAELEDIRRLAAVAGVAGVHLDYVRYPDAQACFCPRCRRRFEQHSGKPAHPWPDAVTTGSRRAEWLTWRAGQISAAVRAASETIRSAAPGRLFSVAVFPNPHTSVESIGQDWARWAREGWVDWFLPMNYTVSTAEFTRWVRLQQTLPGLRGRLLPGIGVTASTSRLDAVGVLAQAESARAHGTLGFALFDLNHSLRNEIFPALAERNDP